ncbi:MAG: nucleotide sugar dehydrogenase [Candidatus Bathyarchaeota archaeon]|nr:nucleotide sugar dehydrogenase [Candidatus Bathyarchaeota archaeon]
MIDELVNKIHSKQFNLAVIGAGYVGLPTAALFADAGFFVTAVDIRPAIIEEINNRKSPIDEPNLEQMIARNVEKGKLKASLTSTLDFTNLDGIIFCVQTPINNLNSPDLSYLLTAVETVGSYLRKGALVTICSTVPPATVRDRIKPMLESLSGLSVEKDFFLAYAPERIAPGKALNEFVESPRLVGGIGPLSTKVAVALFNSVCNEVIETDASTAEISKLAENTFRDINIAFANQLALICEQKGVDFTKVIALANTHPRVHIHTSGPGVGGPCLTKDPYLLIHEVSDFGKNIVTTAREINNYMPRHIVELTLNALKLNGKKIDHCKIAVLGTAYKADVDDHRLSPAEPIIWQLVQLGAEVFTFDPHCAEAFASKKAKNILDAAKEADCLIITADHSEFKNMYLPDIRTVMNEKPSIIDGKRIINPQEAEKLGFSYFGVGYGRQNDVGAQSIMLKEKVFATSKSTTS